MRALILTLEESAPIDPHMPWWAVLLALIVAVGGGGGIAAAVLLPRTRRKLTAESSKIDAEAAEVLTGAAVALVKPLEQRVTELTGRVDELEAYRAAQAAVLVTHAAWDAMAITKLNDAGIDLPPAPPLHPAL